MSVPIHFEHDAQPDMISIIIPVRADVEGLEITLHSLGATVTSGQRYEIIVANDGNDPAISAVCSRYAAVQEVTLTPNRGPAAARNRAVQKTRGCYIAFLDADVVVQPGWWQALRQALGDCDYAGGRVDINPALVSGFFHRYDAITAFDVKSYMLRHHGATANLAVRRTVLERIGGFDERFRSGEDTEFGIRAHEAGHPMVYAEAMAVLHPPRNFSQQRRKIYRVVLGHLQLASAFPVRFAKYRLSVRLAVSLLVPPRKLAKDPALLQYTPLWLKAGFYGMRYAARLYTLLCYCWLTLTSTENKKHDLS